MDNAFDTFRKAATVIEELYLSAGQDEQLRCALALTDIHLRQQFNHCMSEQQARAMNIELSRRASQRPPLA